MNARRLLLQFRGMTRLAKPSTAVAFGAFFLVAATTAHWGRITWTDWFSWPLPDWVAGSFLVYGGVRGARDGDVGRLYQVAGWAFFASLMFGSFLADLQDWLADVPGAIGAEGPVTIPAGPYVVGVGVGFCASLAGLASSLRRREPRRDVSVSNVRSG